MKIKESFLRKLFIVFNTLLLSAIALIMLYPIVYVLFASLSNSVKLMSYSGVLWKPLELNFEAYRSVSKNPMIISGYINNKIKINSNIKTRTDRQKSDRKSDNWQSVQFLSLHQSVFKHFIMQSASRI